MSFPRYPAYKETNATEPAYIPSHWDLKRLKMLVTRSNAGEVIDKSHWGEGDHRELLYTCALEPLVSDFPDFPDEKRTAKHDLLLTRNGTPYVHKPLANSIYSNVVQRVTLNEKVDRDYMAVAAQHAARSLKGYGVSIESLNYELWKELPICIAPLDEQTAIATFLDHETAKIDALVAEQERLIELLKEKRQAIISHAVTKGLDPSVPMKTSGNQWLGNVPTHWVVCCLKHIKAESKNAFVDGPFGSNLKSEHFIEDGDVYVIESNFATQGRLDVDELKTISKEHFAVINRSEARGGDIIIAKIGAQYGKASILPELDKPAVVSGNSLKLTIDSSRCDVSFVNWHLSNLKALGVIEDIVNATAQPALSLGEMNNLPMLVPPRSEQVEIVQFLGSKLGAMDDLTREAQRTIDLLNERRTALISAAVTGQIDVRGWTPPTDAP